MGERSDGTWAAKQVGVSAPRQNGKSQLIVARALAGALLFGEKKIVISAHAQDTARETFGKFLEIRDACPALDERIDKVMNALNREYIKFHNGAVIQFKARTVSGSRGFSSDCLLLDEAQILGMPAWVSINSTMSARPNPQVWLLGTPPTPEDNGEVFTSIRKAALGGKSRTLAWLEWGAEPDDDPALDSTRAKANPAWHTRINHEIVQGEYETYPPDRFALDRLGRWMSEEESRQLVMPAWPSRKTANRPEKPAALGIAVDLDRVWVSVGACDAGRVPHLGPVHVNGPLGSPVVLRRRLDTERAWVVEQVARIQREHGCAVVLDRKGPAGSLERDLETAGVRITTAGLDDAVTACADLFDAVVSGEVCHGGYEELDAAVESATQRKVGDRWAWARRNGDVSMLEAVTLALWGSKQTTSSIYEGRGLVTL
jgi:hypothetical protein